jgi:hypothetical protein
MIVELLLRAQAYRRIPKNSSINYPHRKEQSARLRRYRDPTYRRGDPGFESWQRQDIFLFFETSSPPEGVQPAAFSMGTGAGKGGGDAFLVA